MSSVAAIVNLLLVLAAIFVPRMFVNREDGLAGAAAVAIIVFCTLGLALLIGIAAAVIAWRKAKKASLPMPLLGFTPLGMFLLGIAGLFVLSKLAIR
jgi:hypothetical protein